MFYNEHVAMKKDTSEEKNKTLVRNHCSCHLLSIEYEQGTMLGPLHFIFMALERMTFIIPQIGKLRFREDIQPGGGRAGT